MTFTQRDEQLLGAQRQLLANAAAPNSTESALMIELRSGQGLKLTFRVKTTTSKGHHAVLVAAQAAGHPVESVTIGRLADLFDENGMWKVIKVGKPGERFLALGDSALLVADGTSDARRAPDEYEDELKGLIEKGDRLAEIDVLAESGADLHAVLDDFYVEFELILDKALTYLRKGAAVHKQAVQNAVDIVQSKRISFLESGKDPYWNGILVMMAIVLFIELAAVPAAVFMGTRLFMGLARIFPRGVAALTKTAGKLPDRKYNHAKLIRAMRQNKRAIRRITSRLRRRSNAPIPPSPYPNQRSELLRRRLLDNRDKKYIENLERRLERLRERRELVGGIEDRLTQRTLSEVLPAVEAKMREAKTVAKLGKEVAGGFVSKKKGAYPKAQDDAIPLDVALKIYVQSFFDEEIWLLERFEADVKAVRESLLLLDDPAETAKQLRIALGMLELFEAIKPVGDSLEALFDGQTIVSLNLQVAAAYERRIWTLLYAGNVAIHRAARLIGRRERHYPVKQDIYDRTVKSRYGYQYQVQWRDISREQYEKWKAEGYVVHVFALEDSPQRKSFFDYMRARFFEAEDNRSIARRLADMHAEIDRAAGDLATRLAGQPAPGEIVWMATGGVDTAKETVPAAGPSPGSQGGSPETDSDSSDASGG